MKTAKLDDVCGLIARGISPKYSSSKGVRIINQKCIRAHTLCFELARIHDIEQKPINEERFVQNGDILINSTGHGTLGRTALAENIDQLTLVDSHITIVRPKEGVFETRYFAYLISRCEDDFIGMATGTSGQTELPRAGLKEHRIEYEENIPEQRRVVERLDAAFEKIDRAIELTEKNVIHAKSLYISARNATIQELAGDEAKSINDIGNNLDNRRIPITKNKRKKGQYPYYGASGIVDYVSDYIFDQEALLISEDGANLLARSTPIAFPASGKYWVNNHAHIYTFSSQITLKYMEYFLENTDLRPFITGAAQPKLSQGNLTKIPIFIPPTEIQDEAVSIISRAKELSESLSLLYEDKLSRLTLLKQSLLTQAFSYSGVE